MIRTSDSLASLAPALVKAQEQSDAPRKTSKNPHFNSTFAGLPEVRAALLPALHANGLALVQVPGWENGAATVITRLVHTSGEWMEFDSGSPVSKADPQGWRSAITYVRRTQLEGIGALAAEDDDGNSASQQPKAKPAAAINPKPQQLSQKNIDALLKKAGGSPVLLLNDASTVLKRMIASMSAADWPALTATQYDDLERLLKVHTMPDPIALSDRIAVLDKLLAENQKRSPMMCGTIEKNLRRLEEDGQISVDAVEAMIAQLTPKA